MRCLAALLALVAAVPSLAQESYPDRPITLVVPNPPGGMNDITARPLANAMQAIVGQPVVVANRPGGTAAVGTAYVASQKPDGHNILVTTPNLFLVFEKNNLFGDPQPYRMEQIAPVALLSADPIFLVVQGDSPWRTAKELLDAARAKQGQLAFASSGPYGILHVPVEAMLMQAGVKVRHVPTTGGGPALVQLLGGHVQFSTGGPAAVHPHIQSGKMRALASFGEKRHPQMADIPTLRELGFNSEAYLWVGLFTTAGVPEPIFRRMREVIAKSARSPDFVKAMANINSIIDHRDGADFQRFFDADHKRLAAAVRVIGKSGGN